jgi:ABC-type proline/glycine betaine transport system substrate-binding protein
MREFHVAGIAVSALTVLTLAAGSASAAEAQKCEIEREIKFSGYDWASNSFHVEVARFILEKGYGCKTTSVPGTTQPLLNALARGDVDVSMELWKENNVEIWAKMVKTGRAIETKGVSIEGAVQGWFVPRYLVEGDAKRGIKASAPGLKKVSDLPRYKSLFRDPEQPAKGRFYNCKIGWNCEPVNTKKLVAYGLTKDYTNFKPGSGGALAAAIASAFKRGKPIVFYYWGPTWVLGKYDAVMLQEPAFDRAKWNKLDKAKSGKGLQAVAYPAIRVTIAVNTKFAKSAPNIIAFFDRYRMQDSMVSAALVVMREKKDKTGRKAALSFLRKHPKVWSKWLPAAIAKRVKEAL